MIVLADGPAVGAVVTATRLPAYLRVVICPDGETFALDKLGDSPESHEQVWVYRLVRKGEAVYVFVDPQPDEKVLRSELWPEWARERYEADQRATRPDMAALWRQIYYRASRGKLTFRQAECLFRREHGFWPGRYLPMMPLHPSDWLSRVGKVAPNRLR